MRKKAVASGVQLLERVMITRLIKPEDKVIGAVGFHMESGRPYAILAKATVMCAGPASFKPLGMGYPCSSATADGDAMAYRAGAEISGKEFNDAPSGQTGQPSCRSLSHPPMKSAVEMGGGPPSAPGPAERSMGPRLGLRIHSASYGVHDGGLPIDPKYIFTPGSAPGRPRRRAARAVRQRARLLHPGHVQPQGAKGCSRRTCIGASNVPGLWAAGDGLSSMQNGAGYAGFGCSCAGSAVQGARAGNGGRRVSPRTSRRPRSARACSRALRREMLDPLSRPARVFACLGDQAAAEHHVPLLRDVREGEEQAGDGAQPDHVPAGEVRPAAQSGRPPRPTAGPRDQEHAPQRRDEAPGRAGPRREPGHALSRGLPLPGRRQLALLGQAGGEETARWRWSSTPSRPSGTRSVAVVPGEVSRPSSPGRRST